MSSRKMQRNALKTQYKKFCLAWKREKAYQRYVLDDANGQLPDGQPLLRRRPTFVEWCDMQERIKALAAQKEAEALSLARVDREEDLDWKEE